MGEASGISEFEEALAKENYVLSDTDPIHPGLSPAYADGVFPANNFLQLDDATLAYMSRHIAESVMLFSMPNIRVPAKVFGEIKIFQDIVCEKMAKLNQLDRQSRERHHKAPNKKYDAMRQGKKDALCELCFDYVNLCRLVRDRVFRPEHPVIFSELEQLIVDVAERCGSKRDFSSRYDSPERKHGDSHADEQLVAAAIYRTLCDGESTAILTPDSDIPRLLADSFRRLTGRYSQFPTLLGRSPIKVYFVLPDKERPARFDVITFGSDYSRSR
jgi:hypothetical protein